MNTQNTTDILESLNKLLEKDYNLYNDALRMIEKYDLTTVTECVSAFNITNN